MPVTHNIKLGELANVIKSFKEGRENLSVANMGDALTKNFIVHI